jgi:hypothetical protein
MYSYVQAVEIGLQVLALLLKILELATVGLFSGLVATFCEEEEAMGGACTSPRPTNSGCSHR